MEQWISNWFDVRNIDHIRAYQYLAIHGCWPREFVPDNVVMNNMWQILIPAKMASEYVRDVITREGDHPDF